MAMYTESYHESHHTHSLMYTRYTNFEKYVLESIFKLFTFISPIANMGKNMYINHIDVFIDLYYV